MELTVAKAETREDFAYCVQIRTLVFVVEQKVEAEIDQHENECAHYLIRRDGKPVGAARWRIVNGNIAKIERMAILAEARGKGIGNTLLRTMLDDIAADKRIAKVKLSAQDHAIPFYQKLGFEAQGDGYLDENMPHHDMYKTA